MSATALPNNGPAAPPVTPSGAADEPAMDEKTQADGNGAGSDDSGRHSSEKTYLDRRASYETRDESAFQGNRRRAGTNASFATNVNGGDDLDRVDSADTAREERLRNDAMSPSRARLAAFRRTDMENMRSAEREASRLRDASKEKPGEQFATPSEHDGDSFDRSADHPAHVPVTKRLQINKKPLTKIAKFFRWVHNFSMLTRWVLYITPPTLIILVPLLVASLVKSIHGKTIYVANIELQWWAVWWEVIWLTLWAGKLASKVIPLIVGPVLSIFTNSFTKWRDLSIALETAFTLFFWWLAIFISWLPIAENHQDPSLGGARQSWVTTLNRIVLTIFIATCLNLVEKLLIQLVAIGFHQRQYEDRIVLNKFNIASLTKLYRYSRETHRLQVDSQQYEFNSSGARTPAAALENVGRLVQTRARDAIGKVAGEVVGKRMEHSTSPRQMVLALLDTTSGAQTLARRLYHSFHANDSDDEIKREHMRDAFDTDEEADAAFAMFDKDFNGDVTCEEMEISCVEIGKERKSITSSLKDLDHAVSKLDDILTVVVAIIVILIFISLISRSFSGVLTSAGTTILGLSWLFSQLAQEFLASIVFVFVKHPFDVGDRCDVLMNGVVTSLIVKEISLMATEFRMLDGRIVQAPNNVLNQLFILNMRRTSGVAEGVPTTLRFGVSIELIDQLRARMVDFVRSEPRDYKPDILTELTDIPNLLGVKLTIIFFHKQNWQNEGLRIGRRNKFMCALMVNCQALGLDSAIFNEPGAHSGRPMFFNYMGAGQSDQMLGTGGTNGGSNGDYRAHTGASDGHATDLFQGGAPIPATLHAAILESQRRGSLAPENAVDEEESIDEHAPPMSSVPHVRPSTATATNRMRRRRGYTGTLSEHMSQVDYSLGAADFATSNANDFFEETQERGLQAVMEVAEEQEERRTEEKHREKKSMSRARDSSVQSNVNAPDKNLRRTNTGMSLESRRNRFRLMPRRDGGNLASRDDEEASVGGSQNASDQLDRVTSNATVDQPRRSGSILRRTLFGRANAPTSAGSGNPLQLQTSNVQNMASLQSPINSSTGGYEGRPSDAASHVHRDMSVIPEGREESSGPPSPVAMYTSSPMQAQAQAQMRQATSHGSLRQTASNQSAFSTLPQRAPPARRGTVDSVDAIPERFDSVPLSPRQQQTGAIGIGRIRSDTVGSRATVPDITIVRDTPSPTPAPPVTAPAAAASAPAPATGVEGSSRAILEPRAQIDEVLPPNAQIRRTASGRAVVVPSPHADKEY